MAKIEFAYMYRKEIADIIYNSRYKFYTKDPEFKKFMEEVVRKKLRYSRHTANYDIFHGISKAYYEIVRLDPSISFNYKSMTEADVICPPQKATVIWH